MSHVVIDALSRRDLRAIGAIDAASYPEPWSRRLWRLELDRTDRVYLGARLDRRLVGFAGGLFAVDDFHVTTVAVDPEQRRSGIAAVLLGELVDRAVARGATGLTLEVRAGNHAARALYERFGFVEAGIRRGYYQNNGEDAVVMWRREPSHGAERAVPSERTSA